MPEKYRADGWRTHKDCWGYKLVTLNHYAMLSIESFLVKRDRGRTNHVNRDQGVEYWNLHNRNDEDDTTIYIQIPKAREELESLMADQVPSRLHHAAVDWHQARLNSLIALDDYLALITQSLIRTIPMQSGAVKARHLKPQSKS